MRTVAAQTGELKSVEHTKPPLVSSDRAAVVLIHGWTGSYPEHATSNSYVNEWAILVGALRNRLGTDTKLLFFHWEEDASTGPAIDGLGTVIFQVGFKNATAAVPIAYLNGERLADQLIDSAPDLRRVTFIAHSAGSWVALAAAEQLLQRNNFVVANVILLDAFVPGVDPSLQTPFTTEKMGLLDSHPAQDRLYRLESYFSYDGTDIDFDWGAGGGSKATSQVFAWRSRDINRKIDYPRPSGLPQHPWFVYSGPLPFDPEGIGHSGPKLFYAHTVVAATQGQTVPTELALAVPYWDFTTLGFYRSLTYEAEFLFPRITAQPQAPSQPVTAGTNVALSVTASRAQSYRWYKDEEPLSEIGSTLSFNPVIADDAGTYVVRIESCHQCYTFSEKTELRVASPQGPVVTTTPASDVKQPSAVLNGTVNGQGLQTTTSFEYGGAAYGKSANAQTISSSGVQPISTTVSGLTCGTAYHFRAKAVSSAGAGVGSDRTFTTSACSNSGGATCGDPIIIPSFPYSDSNTTVGKNSSMDGYSIPPAIGSEAGPEVVYKFTVQTPGNVTVTVTDGSGVDIDPHLLSSCSPSACLVRNDSNFTYSIQAGTYFIVADTWTNASGTRFPGAYSLNVSFVSTDTSSPTVRITSPTSSSSYPTDDSTITLRGTASDNVAVTEVAWTSDRGGSGTASGTANWSTGNITLFSGTNVLRVTAWDAAGNDDTDMLTVTYTPEDTVSPSVTITDPTSSSTFAANSPTIHLGGTASDNTGVTEVTWLNERGGSGRASGTTNWSAANIQLFTGTNVLRVTAWDAASNDRRDTLTVTYTPVEVPESFTFMRFAGSDGGAGYFDGDREAARFSYPEGVATDSAGNVYVADTRNDTIRKITPAGLVTTLAGLAGSSGTDEGRGSAARFRRPYGVATDNAGTVYVADTANHAIRMITPAGLVTTLAGSPGTSGSADGTADAAWFSRPTGIACDGAGNLYVADSGNHTIRRVTAAGVVTTPAGLASVSGSADGFGNAARFNEPAAVAIDSAGNVYVAERSNHTIRKITPTGEVTTYAGLAGNAGTGDGVGNAARFWFPGGVATDSAGNVYVADDLHTIRKISTAGVVTTIAGQVSTRGHADGTGDAAQFFWPRGIATDGAGNLFVADSANGTIRRVTSAGSVTTLAGLAGKNRGGADGVGSAARFSDPSGVATDSSGNVYVADSNNRTIRKITPSGNVSTFAGTAGTPGNRDGTGTAARFRYTHGVATNNAGTVYVADSSNHTIRKITPAGEVTTLAGVAGSNGTADGTGDAARFNHPYDLATDPAGNIFVADTFNNTIRRITPAGSVTTIAGLAGSTGSIDGTGEAARFYSPMGISADGSGNVYVSDSANDTIRKITPGQVVTTIAGLPDVTGAADGTGDAARFNFPIGIDTDSAGNVYVADSGNNTIRKITGDRVVTTLGGVARGYGSTAGVGFAARFDDPWGIAIAADGNLYVSDRNNQAIRVGRRAIPDVAQIDSGTGTIGITRQLDAQPQTASSWQWSVIRRPSGSTVQLSSTASRNPTFTPDVGDLYQFQLIATGSTGTSITIVSLQVSPAEQEVAAPTGVIATAITSTRVDIVWNTTAGVTYQIERRGAGGNFSQIGTSQTNTFSDGNASANSAYLYRVRAVNGFGVSHGSAPDLATTVIFDDAPLTPGMVVKAVHLSQLRMAVNAVRALAGLLGTDFAGAAIATATIQGQHVAALRSSLDAALHALGRSIAAYTNTWLTGTDVKAVHFQELRDRVR